MIYYASDARTSEAVAAVFEVPAKILAAQLHAVFDDLNLNVVKTEMPASAQLIEVVARSLELLQCPIVLDPVMVLFLKMKIIAEVPQWEFVSIRRFA